MKENDKLFHIPAYGTNVDSILKIVEQKVNEKKGKGAYKCKTPWYLGDIDSSERKNDIETYINLIKESIYVDINDFEINDKHSVIGPIVATFKNVIWKCLKFYTYRLWKQQNDINGLIMSVIDAVEEKYKHKFAALEARLNEMEKQIASTKKH